jgi:hypothetical protein
MINEWLMTETNPGDGFTIIEKKPSTISDLLKDVGIKLQSRRTIKEMIKILGETGYFLYHEIDISGAKNDKVYLININKRCVDSILISKQSFVPLVCQKNSSVFYMVSNNIDKRIEFDLFSKKQEPGVLPLHLILINDYIPMKGKFCTTFNLDEGIITIYENFKAFNNGKILARIKL